MTPCSYSPGHGGQPAPGLDRARRRGKPIRRTAASLDERRRRQNLRFGSYARYPHYPQAWRCRFRLGATRREVHKEWVIGTKVPASPERRQRQEGRGRDGRSDLHRQAMRRSFGFKSDQPEEAPEEPDCLARNAVSFGTQATRQRIGPRRAAEENEPVFGLGSISEATPELVSQDRGAGDLRVAKADEHRRILRSAQMGAGSNAGPHFSLGAAGAGRSPGPQFRPPPPFGRAGRSAADKAPFQAKCQGPLATLADIRRYWQRVTMATPNRARIAPYGFVTLPARSAV